MAQQTRHGMYGGARQLYGSFAGKANGGGVGPPYAIAAQDSYNAGAFKHGSYNAGVAASDHYNAGAIKQEGAS